MKEDKVIQPASINTKAIIFGMVLLFMATQISFHPTYFIYFSEFESYSGCFDGFMDYYAVANIGVICLVLRRMGYFWAFLGGSILWMIALSVFY